MVEHFCNKEAEISKIHTIVLRLDKKLDGENGLFSKVSRFEGALGLLFFLITLCGAGVVAALSKIW